MIIVVTVISPAWTLDWRLYNGQALEAQCLLNNSFFSRKLEKRGSPQTEFIIGQCWAVISSQLLLKTFVIWCCLTSFCWVMWTRKSRLAINLKINAWNVIRDIPAQIGNIIIISNWFSAGLYIWKIILSNHGVRRRTFETMNHKEMFMF